MDNSKTPSNLELERVVPTIAEELAAIRGDSVVIKSQINDLDGRLGINVIQMAHEVSQAIQNQQKVFGELLCKLGISLQSNSEPIGLVGNENCSQNATSNETVIAEDDLEEPFKMDRKINTVRGAWLEHTRYIAPLLEIQNGWRKSASETKFYNRRKPLYTAINLLVNGNCSL